MPLIEISNLKVKYYNDSNETLALDNVNVSFLSGKICAIIGPSGCGKTTLLRTICGFLNYEGTILADGVDFSKVDYKHRNMSYVDQSVTLNPNIDVYNNIASSLIINKVNRQEIDEQVKRVAIDLGISKILSLFPKQLSAGQCQLVLLAKAIVKKPDLLLLDEGFSSLNEEYKIKFYNLIKARQIEKPFTMLFVSHSAHEISALADYVVLMEDGKINKLIDRNDKTFNHLQEIMENISGS